MAMVMFIIGCIAVMLGAATIAFGIPVNEFNFGNALIIAGTTIGSSGLILIGLGAVVHQLQRIAETMAERAPLPAGRPSEAFEAPAEARAQPARVPFPPKTRQPEPRQPEPRPPEPAMREPQPMHEPAPPPAGEDHPVPSFAPMLRNPEAPPMTVEDDVSLSPQYPQATPGDLGAPASPPSGATVTSEQRHEPAFDAPWRSAPPPPHAPTPSYFDNMWPAKSARAPAAAPPRPEPPPQPAMSEPPTAAPQHNAAILKSGVVDGMGYTLYVDGSIEAELPQGTLRFASIDELRSHLDQNA